MYSMVPQPGGLGHTRPSRSGGGGALGMSTSPKRVGGALNYAQSFDARAYAAAVASKQAEIMPALFKQDGALEALRPSTANKDPAGYLEVFPKGQRKPQLLTRLENLLQDKLRASDKLSSPDGRSHGAALLAGSGGRRNPGQANLRLDAHRQVLEAFIHAFTTYRPLLLRIKDEYDRALDGALRSEQENARMRAEIACLEQTRLKAVEQARADAASAAGNLRSELHSRLLEAEEREKEAIRRAEAAEARALQLEEEAREAKEEAAKYRDENKSLKDAMFAESTWGQKEIAGVVGSKIIGPKKTDAELAAKPLE